MRVRAVLGEARGEVYASLARYNANPEGYGRDNLRDTVAGALDLCAMRTRLPLATILTILSADADLNIEDLTSEHEGRTPWRTRILREAEANRSDMRRGLRRADA